MLSHIKHLGGMLLTTMIPVMMIHRRRTSVGWCTCCIKRCIEILMYKLYIGGYTPIQLTRLVPRQLYSYTAYTVSQHLRTIQSVDRRFLRNCRLRGRIYLGNLVCAEISFNQFLDSFLAQCRSLS